MSDEKQFPIMPLKDRGIRASVPWSLVLAHEPQAVKNHDQTVAELASRGGLSVCELAAVLEDRRWRPMEKHDAVAAIERALNAQFLRSA